MTNKQQCVLMAFMPDHNYNGMNYALKEAAKNIFIPDGTNVNIVKLYYKHNVETIVEFVKEKLPDAYIALTSDVITPHFVDVYNAINGVLPDKVRPYLYVGDLGRCCRITKFDTEAVQLDLTEEDLCTVIVNRFVYTSQKSVWSTIEMCVPSLVNLKVPKNFNDLTEEELKNIVDVYRIFRGAVTFNDGIITDNDLLQVNME